MLHLLRALTPSQCSTVLASYLGWTVDAFDFFILVIIGRANSKSLGTLAPLPERPQKR